MVRCGKYAANTVREAGYKILSIYAGILNAIRLKQATPRLSEKENPDYAPGTYQPRSGNNQRCCRLRPIYYPRPGGEWGCNTDGGAISAGCEDAGVVRRK